MAEYTKTERMLSDLCSTIDERLKKGEKNVSVFVNRRRRTIINQFCYLFYKNFLDIIESYKLQRNEIRIILKMVEMMEFGNLVSANQTAIAKGLGIDPRNMTKSMRRLKDANLLIYIDGSLYINPHVICKGKFMEEGHEETEYLINESYKHMKEVDIEELTSFRTHAIRKDQREQKQTD